MRFLAFRLKTKHTICLSELAPVRDFMITLFEMLGWRGRLLPHVNHFSFLIILYFQVTFPAPEKLHVVRRRKKTPVSTLFPFIRHELLQTAMSAYNNTFVTRGRRSNIFVCVNYRQKQCPWFVLVFNALGLC